MSFKVWSCIDCISPQVTFTAPIQAHLTKSVALVSFITMVNWVTSCIPQIWAAVKMVIYIHPMAWDSSLTKSLNHNHNHNYNYNHCCWVQGEKQFCCLLNARSTSHHHLPFIAIITGFSCIILCFVRIESFGEAAPPSMFHSPCTLRQIVLLTDHNKSLGKQLGDACCEMCESD